MLKQSKGEVQGTVIRVSAPATWKPAAIAEQPQTQSSTERLKAIVQHY